MKDHQTRNTCMCVYNIKGKKLKVGKPIKY